MTLAPAIDSSPDLVPDFVSGGGLRGTGTGTVPVAFLGRTSTLALQDPVASLRRQLRKVEDKLPDGWYIAAHYWDVESGGLDLEQRGHGTGYDKLNVGIPRDGGLAALLAETGTGTPRFAAVMCKDIARSGRDTFNALKLEKQLTAAGVQLIAADEPIDTAAASATTLLVRRMKQAVAEWLRYEVKEKAAAGFTEHALAGYNIGPVPYGYQADRIPHPVPSKAAQGRTKTRLVPDPATAPVVEQIYTWRTTGGLGMNIIAVRLNADPVSYPPPGSSGCWQLSAVANILGNPKYTGHMVYGRTRTTAGQRGRRTPPGQWLWTPEPVHPPIVTRQRWDAAQAAGTAHATSTDTPGMSCRPAAKTVYPLRGVVRCHLCGRRMTGHRKTSPSGQVTLYYACTHDPANPRHTTAHPGHPATIRIRQDVLTGCLTEFFGTRIFGPDRARLLAATLQTTPAVTSRQREHDTSTLTKRLREIDAAEDAYTREIEQLAALDAASPAITALRTRILARFSELETERAGLDAKLAALTAEHTAEPDPALLDHLPQLGISLPGAPAELQQELYRLFCTQLTWNHHTRELTCHATITNTTPADLAALITSQDSPGSTTTRATGDLLQHAGLSI